MVPPSPRDVPVELRLDGSRPAGRVRVGLQGPTGEELREWLAVFHTVTAVGVGSFQSRPETATEPFDWPPGRYLVEVRPGKAGRSWWAPLRQTIEVRSGEETVLALRVGRRGGAAPAVRPAARDSPQGADVPDVAERAAPGTSGQRGRGEASRGFGPGESPEDDQRGEGEPLGGSDRRSRGNVLLLDPGPHDVAVRVSGFRAWEGPVEIVEGKGLEVEVALVPE